MGYSPERYDDEERWGYLHDMDQIIREGGCEYQNPFGEDDREMFADQFVDLTDAERRAFRARAAACIRAGRDMTSNDLNSVLVDAGPKEPYIVSLRPTAKASAANGTERRPFASLKAASKGREGSTVRVIHCAPSCKRVKCFRPGCTKMLCTKHGSGLGRFNDECGKDVCGDEDGVVWFFSKCQACNDSVGCNEDQRHELRECDVCRNLNRAEIELGAHDTVITCHLCDKCAIVCDGRIGDEHEDRVAKKVLGDGDDGSEKGSDEGVCGFRCCPECLQEHTCGNDPSEYC